MPPLTHPIIIAVMLASLFITFILNLDNLIHIVITVGIVIILGIVLAFLPLQKKGQR